MGETDLDHLPKYIKIRDQVRKEILAEGSDGKHYTVVDLASRFGVNRLTARHAIEGLIQEGLIRSVKGVGVFASPQQRIVENINEPSNYVYQYAREGRDVKIQTRKMAWIYASAEIAQNLKIRQGTKVLYIERLRIGEGIPLTLDFRHVRTPWANALTAGNLETGVLRRILEKETGVKWHGMSNQIEAAAAAPEIAEALGIPTDSPVMIRKTVMYGRGEDEAIVFSISYYPADRFKWQSYIEFKEGGE